MVEFGGWGPRKRYGIMAVEKVRVDMKRRKQ